MVAAGRACGDSPSARLCLRVRLLDQHSGAHFLHHCSCADGCSYPPGSGFSYSTLGDSFWTGFFAAALSIALLAAGYQVYRLYWSRRPYRGAQGYGQEFSREAQQLFQLKDGAGDRGTSSSVSSPARSRRRGGGVLVKSTAGP